MKYFLIALIFLSCKGSYINHNIVTPRFKDYIGKTVKYIQPANINGYGYGCDVVIYFTDGTKLILSCAKYKMRVCE